MKKIGLLAFLASSIIYGQENGVQSGGVRLSESVISVTGITTTILDEVTNIDVITKEKIEEKNYKNVEDILRDSPGVNIVHTNSGPVIDMRGSGDAAHTNVRVLLDGVPMNSMNNFRKALSINSIPVNSIERIEIAPGGGAVLYGNGVSGGVVNIVRKSNQENGGYAEVDYGSYNSKRVSTGGTYNLREDLTLGLSYTGVDTDAYKRGDSSTSDNIDGSLEYRLSNKHKFRFDGTRFVENEMRSDSASRKSLEEDRRSAGPALTDAKFVRERLNGKYEYTPNENFNFSSILYTNNIKNLATTVTSTTGATTEIADLSESTNGALLKTVTRYDRGSLIVGLDLTESEFKGDTTAINRGISTRTNVDYSKDVISPYILNQYRLTEKWEIITGYRHEWSKYNLKRTVSGVEDSRDISNENHSYEGVLSYKYRDTGNVYARFEKGYMAPTTNQMSNTVNSKTEFSNLKSESSNTFEIGIKDLINDNTFLTFTAFQLDKEKEIARVQWTTTDPDGTPNINRILGNIGETQRRGVEFGMQNYLGNLTLNSGFTYIKAVQVGGVDDGKKLDNIPDLKINIGATYKFTPKIDSTITYLFMGEKTARNVDVSTYEVVDFSIRFRPTENLTLKTGINNLLNEKYNFVEHVDTESPAPERNFYIGGKYTF